MKIKGIPVGTTSPRPNWAQTDPRKADFILNKPSFEAKQNQLAWVTEEDLDAMFGGTYEGVDKETYIDDDLVVDTLYAMTDVVVAGKSLKDLSIGSGGSGGGGEVPPTDELVQAVIDALPIYDGSYTEIFDSPLPTEIATEEEMTALLDTAEVGSVYKYTGESGTYENGALYVVEESV